MKSLKKVIKCKDVKLLGPLFKNVHFWGCDIFATNKFQVCEHDTLL